MPFVLSHLIGYKLPLSYKSIISTVSNVNLIDKWVENVALKTGLFFPHSKVDLTLD